MDEYISKEYVINKCKEHRELYISAWGNFSAMPKEDKATCDAYATCWSDVVNAPPADVQPVRHGSWITSHPVDAAKEFKCIVCGGLIELPVFAKHCYYDYCPNCGARMDLKDSDTNGT